eukprot:TRINITY_DN11297_c0_g1_i1.p1 TRINITY_DN11297_c0_g1~~TRINITY_DN11297_c0_g1_i1.p1  ORF type:complete len:447 (-),score=110.54 TRINITY_DN11297_c0_g1_i1:20-1216(-)
MSKAEKKDYKKQKALKKKQKKSDVCSNAQTSHFEDSFVQNIHNADQLAREGDLGDIAFVGMENFQTAGSEPGIVVWRVENFSLNAWPEDLYGSFYDGDSYLVLHTYENGSRLQWDIYFWLGENTTTDEAGTVAYKTVELDDRLGGLAVQYREVQDYESEQFLSLFPPCLRILKGGIDSGFNHVEEEEHRARLLHLKGKKTIRVKEVGLEAFNLNAGDVFILDNGTDIYIWNGNESGVRERQKGGELGTALRNERNCQATIHQMEQGDEDPEFWEILGGETEIATAEEGGCDFEAEKDVHREPALLKVSNATGELVMTEKARGVISRDMLESEDAFVYDTGYEIWVWIGAGASSEERRDALHFAEEYLRSVDLPSYFPISRVIEGGENPAFNAAFHGFI